MINKYYHLSKPGIVRSNVMIAVAAYIFAQGWHIQLWQFLSLVIGTTLIIAAACTINNVIDRQIDARMQRTQKRALVTGAITPTHALIFAGLAGLSGFTILLLGTNVLTTLVGLVGFLAYTVAYSIGKRQTVFGTAIGTISGATPPVAGYVAVTNHLDITALVLFVILVFWQMAHFYAIATFRAQQYRAAGLPVLPVVKGMERARSEIIAYILLFIIAAVALSAVSHTSILYLVAIVGCGVFWFIQALKPIKPAKKWGHAVFGSSLIVLMSFAVLLILNPLLT